MDGPVRTLVVEDDPTSRRLLHDILVARGHEVETHGDAETAWAAYQRERYPVVVLDWKLPGMDGIELCRRIREVPDSRDTFILFITGYHDPEALQEALEAGASDYLEKEKLQERIDVRLAIVERHVRQVRERRDREEELVRHALRDPLTGLSNRGLFQERLDRAARRSRRAQAHLFAVLVVDLYDFQEVNARHGRKVGDRVLVEAGRRLEECVRAVDTVARLQDDDFAILLDGMKDVSDPTRVAHRIQRALSNPFRIGEGEVFVGACVGIAVSVTGYSQPDDLLRDGQQALLRAKEEGRGSNRMFDPVMHARARARVELEAKIRQALDTDQLVLHYQPVVALEAGRAVSVEALVRWRDPERGLVEPAEFVPVAEDTGLTVPLGWWVLRTALAQLARWRREHPALDGLTVCVNVSSRQFAQPDLFEFIEVQLRENGLQGEALGLEITESSLMSDADLTARLLRQLKEQRVRLLVDDFGTGYSSLSYLCRFPIDTLKVDRSFVQQMTHSAGGLEVVRTIVRLAGNLGMDVVAEGVETGNQRELLEELGCHAAQGFLFSRPLEAEQVPRWMGRVPA